MALKERLSETMKSAMKSGEKDRLGFARNLHAAIRKLEIDTRADLDDTGVVKVVGTLIKQRRDSIEQFKKGQRQDLVEKEEAELKFLQSFMPEQISELELQSLVRAAIAESGAKDPKDLGKVMKVLLPKTQGRADGKVVTDLVRQGLAGGGGA